MAQYGMVYDANSIKRQLYESNRGYNQRKTWEQMYLGNSIAGQKSDAAATGAYSNIVNDAYAASSMGKNAIQNSGLGQGFQNRLLEENDMALQQAFDSYSQNLANTRQGIDYSVQENAMAIDNAATQQADYTKDYANAHFNYLDNLYAGYERGENTLFDSKQWSKYLTDVIDEEGNPTGEKRLMSRDELMAPSFTEGENGKEWTSLYDDQGNLTVRGLDFFDQLENQNVTANSFGSYLAGDKYDGETAEDAKKRQELFKWSQSYNPYNYTFDGTNKGTFKTMVGMSSTDNMYTFAERFGGFTTQEVDNLYEGFNNAVTKLSTSSKEAKNTTKAVNNLLTEVEKLATDLGIEEDFKFEELRSHAEAYVKGTKTNRDMAGDFVGTTLSATAGGGATGTGIGAGLGLLGGPFAPLTSTGGAISGGLIGGIIGLIGGIIKSSVDVHDDKERNRDLAKQSKEMYTQLLNEMINYSMAKQKQAQLDFATQNNRF